MDLAKPTDARRLIAALKDENPLRQYLAFSNALSAAQANPAAQQLFKREIEKLERAHG